MHKNGKPYIATKENINKYTINKFRYLSINSSNKINIIKMNKHQSNKIPKNRIFPTSSILIMFENDLYISNRFKLFNGYSKVYLLLNRNIDHNFILSTKVINFKQNLIVNINKSIPNSKIVNSNNLEIILNLLM